MSEPLRGIVQRHRHAVGISVLTLAHIVARELHKILFCVVRARRKMRELSLQNEAAIAGKSSCELYKTALFCLVRSGHYEAVAFIARLPRRTY
jgi:hypothetical protein